MSKLTFHNSVLHHHQETTIDRAVAAAVSMANNAAMSIVATTAAHQQQQHHLQVCVFSIALQQYDEIGFLMEAKRHNNFTSFYSYFFHLREHKLQVGIVFIDLK